jgi:hypothetical protein
MYLPQRSGRERAGLHRAGGHTDGDHQLHGRKAERNLYAGVFYRLGPPIVNRVQISSGGYPGYPPAMEGHSAMM